MPTTPQGDLKAAQERLEWLRDEYGEGDIDYQTFRPIVTIVEAQQLGQEPPPLCTYCGYLGWTVEHYGRVTHKEACPHRTDPWHQGSPRTWREEHQREDGSYDAETWGEVDEDGNRVERTQRAGDSPR